MCKYCEMGKILTSGECDYGMAIQPNNQLMVCEYDFDGEPTNEVEVSINYCPMCGRKLKEVE